MRGPAFALALVAMFGATFCAGGSRAPAPAPVRRAVAIQGFEYRPKAVTAALGDTIAWTNGDVVPHSVTADDKTFDSPDVPPKEHFEWVAVKPGTFAYHCEVHPAMVGTVTVK